MLKMGSGFNFTFASAFGIYFDFDLGADFFFILETYFGSAFRVGLWQTLLQICFLVVA